MKLAAPVLQPVQVQRIFGPLGEAMDQSLENRLKTFVRDAESEPLQLFLPERKNVCDTGDWYGEHVGKWLVAASRAFKRTGDAELKTSLATVLSVLRECQEPNGYLGTYSPTSPSRMTSPDAVGTRTWDVWVHAMIILGLLELGDALGTREPVAMAERIGALIMECAPPERLLRLGNHNGLSALVVLEPMARLAQTADRTEFAGYAERCLAYADANGLPFLSLDLDKGDICEVGSGKIYQILWCLVGIVELAAVLSKPVLTKRALELSESVAQHHLTPQGGPWGGIAGHKEVFNSKGFFDPNGMVETCSTATWIKLCRMLYEATGHQIWIDRAESSLVNALLGAVSEDARNWIYFSFPNGRRNFTYHWACCKSSGAMALEEAAFLMLHRSGDLIHVHGIAPFDWHAEGASLKLSGLPEDRSVRLEYDGPSASISLREPPWGAFADSSQGPAPKHVSGNATVEVALKVDIRTEPFTYSVDHHGQEIVRTDYLTAFWGPYSLAAGLFDGYRKDESLPLPKLFPESAFAVVDARAHQFELRIPGRDPIPMRPYFLCGGRCDGGWRRSWLQVAWQ